MTREDAPARQDQQVMTGAQVPVRVLEELGVTDIFGMPGGAALSFYDPLLASTKIRHALVRHEQGAGHVAEGHAMVTGYLGVYAVTFGPGATNLITLTGDAYMDFVPMLAIIGQVGSRGIGTGAFQEAGIVGATTPFVKHSFPITRVENIIPCVAEALHIVSIGHPGSVPIDISKDAQEGLTELVRSPTRDLPGYHLPGKPNQRRLAQAAEVIPVVEQPALYLGDGLNRARVPTEDLIELIELIGVLFIATLTALDAMPSEYSLNLGMPGVHGTMAIVGVLQRADAVACLGARSDDRVTGKPDIFVTKASVIHVDVDSVEISKIRTADVLIVGDPADVVPALSAEFRDHTVAEGRVDIASRCQEIERIQVTCLTGWTDIGDGLL